MNAIEFIVELISLSDDLEKPPPHPEHKFPNYWSMIVYNANLTNSNHIVVEAIRQWLILILSFGFVILFWASIKVLHKA